MSLPEDSIKKGLLTPHLAMQVTAYLNISTECVPIICVLKVLSLNLLIPFWGDGEKRIFCLKWHTSKIPLLDPRSWIDLMTHVG